jgi:hypothetical protein
MRPRAPLPPFFPPEFYAEIVHEIDPQQEITDEALAKFNQLADDFVTQAFREAVSLVGRRRQSQGGEERPQVTADDIHYILQNRFGMSVSGSEHPIPELSARTPTDEYREKLRTVRECASHRDD